MPNLMLDVTILERQIAELVTEFPELADDEALRADVIEGQTDAMEFLERLTSELREAEAAVATKQTRINDIKSRQASDERRAEAMRKLALRLMTAGDLKTARLVEGTLSRVKGRQFVAIDDEKLLPQWAKVSEVKTSISKTAIKEALESGITVTGARLDTGPETLQVR